MATAPADQPTDDSSTENKDLRSSDQNDRGEHGQFLGLTRPSTASRVNHFDFGLVRAKGIQLTDMVAQSETLQLKKRTLSSRPLAIHACPQIGCTRRFNRKYTLAEHIKTHTGERPHVCPMRTCGKRFSTSGNLSRHKRLHGYIEPLRCPVQGCICTFLSNNKLEKHMNFHYGGPVKVCLVPGCGKTFSTTGNLNRHLKHQHLGQYVLDQQVPKTMPSQFVHRSPTSTEQWPVLGSTVPVFKPRVTMCWPQQITFQQQQLPVLPQMPQGIYSPTRSCSGLFEDVWNAEMLDILENVLHDSTVRC